MLSDKIKTYITQHTSPEIGILAKLNKETNQKTPMLQMLAGHYRVYANISFEREAYQNEGNSSYLRNRKLWTFLHYLKK